jgi:hypothetical protein
MVRRRLAMVSGGALLVGLLSCALILQTASAADFANPAFQQLWAKTDANPGGHTYVWGPAPTTGGLQEDYKEAAGGKRLVQYFDKGRMELGANNTVTAGLLTVELITGKQQNGDATFQQRDPAKVTVAGDPDNPYPTYADLAKLQGAEQNNSGKPVTKQVKPDGTTGTYGTKGDAQAVVAAFDDTTKHNLPKAFADFRTAPDFGGLSAIGLAITEPVWATVKVGGKQKDVLMQGFERRVLTYTPSNPDGFKVEYGNIGQAYYAWRYPSGSAPAASNATPAAPAKASAPAGSAPAASHPPAVLATQAPAPPPTGVNIVVLPEPDTPKTSAPINLTIKVTNAGAAVPNTGVHVDWKLPDGSTQGSDATTNKDGLAYVSKTFDNVLAGQNVQITVTASGATTAIGVLFQ